MFGVFRCTSSKKVNYTCGNDPALLPNNGKKNEVDLVETGNTENQSALIKGYVHSLKDDEPAVFVALVLENNVHRYTASSNLDGQFSFKEVNAGTYQLTAKSTWHRHLLYDSIHIRSGLVYKLDIKLGFIGKDEN